MVEATQKYILWKEGERVECVDLRGRRLSGLITAITPARVVIGGRWVSATDFTREMKNAMDPRWVALMRERHVEAALAASELARQSMTENESKEIADKLYKATGYTHYAGLWWCPGSLHVLVRARWQGTVDRMVADREAEILPFEGFSKLIGDWVPTARLREFEALLAEFARRRYMAERAMNAFGMSIWEWHHPGGTELFFVRGGWWIICTEQGKQTGRRLRLRNVKSDGRVVTFTKVEQDGRELSTESVVFSEDMATCRGDFGVFTGEPANVTLTGKRRDDLVGAIRAARQATLEQKQQQERALRDPGNVAVAYIRMLIDEGRLANARLIGYQPGIGGFLIALFRYNNDTGVCSVALGKDGNGNWSVWNFDPYASVVSGLRICGDWRPIVNNTPF
jgi:hypothetical protein